MCPCILAGPQLCLSWHLENPALRDFRSLYLDLPSLPGMLGRKIKKVWLVEDWPWEGSEDPKFSSPEALSWDMLCTLPQSVSPPGPAIEQMFTKRGSTLQRTEYWPWPKSTDSFMNLCSTVIFLIYKREGGKQDNGLSKSLWFLEPMNMSPGKKGSPVGIRGLELGRLSYIIQVGSIWVLTSQRER